jgi:serine/threonine protein phosphatase PrpC
MSNGPDSQRSYSGEEEHDSGFFEAPGRERLTNKMLKIEFSEMEGGKVVSFYTGKSEIIAKLKLNAANPYWCTYSLILPDSSEVLLLVPKQASAETVIRRYVVGLERFPKQAFFEAGSEIAKQQFAVSVTSKGDLLLDDCGSDFRTFIERPRIMDEDSELSEEIEQVPCGGDGNIEGMVQGREFFGGTSKKIGRLNVHKDYPSSPNEDNIGVNMQNAVFALADGVSNSIAGEIAAHKGVESIVESDDPSLVYAASQAGNNHWYLNAFLSGIGNNSDTCLAVCRLDEDKMEAFGIGDVRVIAIGEVDGKPRIIFHTVRHSYGAGLLDRGRSRRLQSGEEKKVTERDVCTDPDFTSNASMIFHSLSTDVRENRLPDISSVNLPPNAYVLLLSDGMDLLEHELIDCVWGKTPKEAYDNIHSLISKKNSSIRKIEFGAKVPMYLQNFQDGGDDEYIRPPLDNGSCIVIGPKKV